MYLSYTLTRYIARKFGFWVVATTCAMAGIVLLFDFVELMRRAANRTQAGIDVVFQMSLLKLPNMIELMLPFAILFAAMITFARLTRSQELVIARSSGVSVWQFLLPVMTVAFCVGLLLLTIFNPIASSLLSRFENLEARYLTGEASQIAVIEDGVWLRQAVENTQAVIHAVRLSQDDLVLQDVTVFRFQDNAFTGRIDADVALLGPGYWQFENAYVAIGRAQPERFRSYTMPTNLTKENILDSFAAPETLSFWQLPQFIGVLEKAGFSALRHKLHLNSLIATPVLFCAMVLVAAVFSLRTPRRGRVMMMIIGGIFVGFVLFFLNDILSALGVSDRIPILMAAWMPPALAILFGSAALLHLEDG